ncbi:hypothetical protein CULT_2550001 [[Clostridium] ultunense Esp]|nr:hypothetical protein CULT_2550001 [[Clostridium] ultunense Esp]
MLYIIYSTKKQKILFAFKDFLLFYKKFILCLQSEIGTLVPIFYVENQGYYNQKH